MAMLILIINNNAQSQYLKFIINITAAISWPPPSISQLYRKIPTDPMPKNLCNNQLLYTSNFFTILYLFVQGYGCNKVVL